MIGVRLGLPIAESERINPNDQPTARPVIKLKPARNQVNTRSSASNFHNRTLQQFRLPCCSSIFVPSFPRGNIHAMNAYDRLLSVIVANLVRSSALSTGFGMSTAYNQSCCVLRAALSTQRRPTKHRLISLTKPPFDLANHYRFALSYTDSGTALSFPTSLHWSSYFAKGVGNKMTPTAIDDIAAAPSVPNTQQQHPPSVPTVPSLLSLMGKTIAITGGGRGLGMELAFAVVESGGHVACLDILPSPSETQWPTLLKL
jgi:hypothetical protein